MDGFTFHDLFDTKGIEYLIIIGFLLVLVPFWILLNRPLRPAGLGVKQAGALLLEILRIPQGVFYSANHTWSRLERSGEARIGLDDLLLHITGPVEVRSLRNPGERVKKGEIIAEISRQGKKLGIASPLSGEITGLNSALGRNPGILTEDPYGEGWICRLRPSGWIGETASCYLADEAVEWIKRELHRLRDFMADAARRISAEPGLAGLPVLQEGGELPDRPLAEMPGEVWLDFQESFLGRG
jgi:glycine cleavage system H protein